MLDFLDFEVVKCPADLEPYVSPDTCADPGLHTIPFRGLERWFQSVRCVILRWNQDWKPQRLFARFPFLFSLMSVFTRVGFDLWCNP